MLNLMAISNISKKRALVLKFEFEFLGEMVVEKKKHIQRFFI